MRKTYTALLAILVVVGLSASRGTCAGKVITEGAFVHLHVVDGFACPVDEVMIGIHVDLAKVICASLNFGYRTATTAADPARGTEVSSSPSMHGCAKDFFIQKIDPSVDELTCVSLQTKEGLPL